MNAACVVVNGKVIKKKIKHFFARCFYLWTNCHFREPKGTFPAQAASVSCLNSAERTDFWLLLTFFSMAFFLITGSEEAQLTVFWTIPVVLLLFCKDYYLRSNKILGIIATWWLGTWRQTQNFPALWGFWSINQSTFRFKSDTRKKKIREG